MKQNIILIGMPGAGKSTVGVVLAKVMGYRFLDSDLAIQEETGKLLHELISEHGIEGFWEIENRVNCSLNPNRCVVATGGSAVYGAESMERFREIGTVVYLQISLDELENRLGDLVNRGVTIREGQTLNELYFERCTLYEKYAHVTVDCNCLSIREVVDQIVKAV